MKRSIVLRDLDDEVSSIYLKWTGWVDGDAVLRHDSCSSAMGGLVLR